MSDCLGVQDATLVDREATWLVQCIVRPLAWAVVAASWSRWGQGFSGLTKSRVTGEMPPQSEIPLSSRARQLAARSPGPEPASSSCGDKFGGAWICISGPRSRRAAAMVQRSSSKGGSG